MAPNHPTPPLGTGVSAFKLTAFRITATVLAVFAAVLAVVGDHAFIRAAASGGGWSPEQAAWINGLFEGLWTAEALLAAAIALALVWRASHRVDARALTWFLVLLALLNFAEPLRALGLVPATAAAGMALDVLGGATWWLALAAFLRFSVLFPRPLTSSDLDQAGLAHWRTRLLDARVVWSGAVLLALLSFALAQLVGGDVGAAAPVAFRLAGFIVLLGLMVGFLWGVLQGVRHLRIRYRTVQGGDRRRILWVVQGFFLAMWAIFIGLAALLPAALAVLGGRGGWIWPVLPVLAIAMAPLVIVLFLAVAIFYDGAIDPALVIRRTAVYGVFGVVLTFLFEGMESLTSSVIAGRLGIPEGWAGWIAAGGSRSRIRLCPQPVGRASGADRGTHDSDGGRGRRAGPRIARRGQASESDQPGGLRPGAWNRPVVIDPPARRACPHTISPHRPAPRRPCPARGG